MYRVYAQDPQARINLGIRRRLAPLLENHRAKIELMNGLLFSLPGTPVLYYGDEIGMGDNIYLGDRNGVRTPMQWNAERNAGFSRANPQSLYLPVVIDPEYHYQAVNVEVQQNNPHSLLWWTKRLIDLRKNHRAFGRGSVTFLTPANHKVLAFIRSYSPSSHSPLSPGERGGGEGEGDDILVVANLSRFTQYVELDLAAFAGRAPVELFGRSTFPPVGDRPYPLSLGPYAFHWFALERGRAAAPAAEAAPAAPVFEASAGRDELLTGAGREALQERLPAYLAAQPWFVSRAAPVEAAMILELIPVPTPSRPVYVALVQVEYSEGDAETYILPLTYAAGAEAERVRAERPRAVVAEVRPTGGFAPPGVLFDALGEPAFSLTLLEALLRRRRFRRHAGELAAVPLAVPPGDANGRVVAPQTVGGGPTLLRQEQRNTSVVFGDQFILKVYRRIEDGVNPEVEVGRFLAEKTAFRRTPRLAGWLEYRRGWGEPMT